jgi:hypothetical protein
LPLNEQPWVVEQVMAPQVTEPATPTVAKLRHCPPAQPVAQLLVAFVPLLVQVIKVLSSTVVQDVRPAYQVESESVQSPELVTQPVIGVQDSTGELNGFP